MKSGLKHTSRAVVDDGNTAAAAGSGDLPVFATPAMIALMENAAATAVCGELPAGSTTVGILVNIVHSRATAVGEEVWAVAELREADGRKLIFHVMAFDSGGVIGEGVHERMIVDREKFMGRLGGK